MLYGSGSLHFLQGPENFPSDAVMSYFANVAKNGAAVVTCPGGRKIVPREKINAPYEDAKHSAMWDIDDPSVQNYY